MSHITTWRASDVHQEHGGSTNSSQLLLGLCIWPSTIRITSMILTNSHFQPALLLICPIRRHRLISVIFLTSIQTPQAMQQWILSSHMSKMTLPRVIRSSIWNKPFEQLTFWASTMSSPNCFAWTSLRVTMSWPILEPTRAQQTLNFT